MLDRYWFMYVEKKEAYYYYWHYQITSKYIDNLITGFLLLTSSAALAASFIWEQQRLVWVAIVAAAQILTAMKSLFPFAERARAVKLLMPDMDELLLEIDQYWCFVNKEDTDVTADEINGVLHEFERRMHKLEHRLTSGTFWPRSKWCAWRAKKDRSNYFMSQYGVVTEDETALWKKVGKNNKPGEGKNEEIEAA